MLNAHLLKGKNLQPKQTIRVKMKGLENEVTHQTHWQTKLQLSLSHSPCALHGPGLPLIV